MNGVAPGAIQTNINRDAWQTPRSRDQLLQLIPYGRIGLPEDIARAVAWLVSDAADYVVGTTLFVDGGMTLYPGFAAEYADTTVVSWQTSTAQLAMRKGCSCTVGAAGDNPRHSV